MTQSLLRNCFLFLGLACALTACGGGTGDTSSSTTSSIITASFSSTTIIATSSSIASSNSRSSNNSINSSKNSSNAFSSSSSISISSSSASSQSSSASLDGVVVLHQYNFNDGKIPSGDNVYTATDRSAQLTVTDGALRGQYPIPAGDGGYFIWTTFYIPQTGINELFIEFKAKMPGPFRHGCKFLKIFGQNTPSTGYANTTFGLGYEAGEMYNVSFGSGTVGDGNDQQEQLENDTHNIILFSGDYPQWIGRSFPNASVLTPQKSEFQWSDDWHHFRIKFKFNSGNTKETETADGEYYVEIDNKIYVDAKGLFNRHHLNLPIDKVELFGWAQNGTHPFELWYDDVIISTGNFTSNPILD